MNILVFEDNLKDYENLNLCIKMLFQILKINYEIKLCKDKRELFKIINNYDLLFLDIELDKENGIDIGMTLRDMNIKCKIIITTSYSKYAIEGYKINAERYFIKPINQKEFNIEMKVIIEKYYKDQLGFFDSKIKTGKIYFKDVLYIESINRKIYFHFVNERIVETTYSMKQIDEIFKVSFFSHPCKSFFINLNYVSGFQKNNVILINEELIPITRHFKERFMLSYEDNLHETL